VGFVGAIAAGYIIDKLKMDCIGYIQSDKIPGIAVIHDSKPCHSIRIYAKDDLIIVMSELIIPPHILPEISDALAEWLGEIEPKQVISLAGISGKGVKDDEGHAIFGISTDDELNKKIKKMGVRVISDGVLGGISADILLYCYENNIPSISLMVETRHIPDPLAAVSVLEILNKLLALDISLKHLIEEGEKIEKLFNALSDELKRGIDRYKKMENYSPMYA